MHGVVPSTTPATNNVAASNRARTGNGVPSGDHARRRKTAARTSGIRNRMFATIIATTPIIKPNPRKAQAPGRVVRRCTIHHTTNQKAARR